MATLSTLSIAGVSTREEALELYKQIEQEERLIGKELDQLLEQQSLIDAQLGSFTKIIPNLDKLHREAQHLSSAITDASTLAASISNKVHILDTGKRNVFGALKRVGDIIDLKNCVSGVDVAMDCGNYEDAAAHIRRYLDLDESVLSESSYVTTTKGSSSVSSSFSKLKSSEEQLQSIVHDKLSKAINTSDKPNIIRFVKLFPLLNLHKQGIDYLTGFINNQLKLFTQSKLNDSQKTPGEPNGLLYANILMELYELIARQLEEHLPMIQSCYGDEWICGFIKRIQVECDKQVGDIVQQLSEDRLIEHKTQTIGIALNTRHTAGAIRPDPRELDTLLTELSLISSRTQLYYKFVTKKAISYNASSSVTSSDISDILRNSGTSHRIQETISWYILIENYFMRESIAKAVSVDQWEEGQLTSSLPDDAFFVFQKSLKRAFSTGNIDGSCAMINNTSTLLLNEFRTELVKYIRDKSYHHYNSGVELATDVHSVPLMFHGSSGRVSLPKGDNWMLLGITCGNIDVSCNNLKKLITHLQNEISLLVTDHGGYGKEKLDSCLSELCTVTGTLKELKMNCYTYIIDSLMITNVSQIIDQFSSVTHVIQEDSLSDDEFIQKLALSLSQTLDEAKSHLLPHLYDDVIIQFTSKVNDLLENQILISSFNQLGGVKLDRDIRQLMSYMSSRTLHPIRDRYGRLLQMAAILSFDKISEVVEYCNMKTGRCHLTNKDIHIIIGLRKDLIIEDINNIILS